MADESSTAQYRVEQAEAYSVQKFPATRPSEAVREPEEKPLAVAPSEPPPPRDAVAVIAMHGMGSQIEFQTLDQIAQGLIKAERELTGTEVKPVAKNIRAGDTMLRRLEFELGAREVHVYEAYWAPFTEGVVGARDVIGFLFAGGTNGLLTRLKTFQRWMFGGLQKKEVVHKTRAYLILALAVVLSLVGLNAALAFLYGPRLIQTGKNLTNPRLVADFTVVVDLLLVFVLGFVIPLWAAMLWKRRRDPKGAPGSFAIPSWLNHLIKLAFYVALFAIVLAALVVAWLFFYHRKGCRPPLFSFSGFLTHPVAVLITAGLLLAVSYFIRRFIVQYAGDVAAYVFPFQLDRFNDVRSKIKDCASHIATAVYGLSRNGIWEYRKVVFVGHSLGSVIAYDTLNRVLAEDDAAASSGFPTFRSLERTCGLVTFACPLDKIAFLFRLQEDRTTEAREALSAVVQPLIQDVRFRPPGFQWINVFAPNGNDIIGSSLEYFDDANGGCPDVVNEPDPDASIPVYAHVEHWDNKLLWQKLHGLLMSC